MAYTTIDDPSDYFNTVLWTGNGSARSITGVGFAPDLVWSKGRQATSRGLFHDTIRGATKYIDSTRTIVETTNAQGLTAFGSDGFSLGTTGEVNYNGDTFVAWNWLAETSFTNDASSTSIGATDSAGSVNDTAGFSICTYTGVGGTSTTIKHGLSTAPTVMFIKNRDDSDDWAVYHQGIGNTHRLYLNNTDAATDAIGTFRDTSPTSSIFTVGDHASVNISGEKYVAYIFAEKKGYSKFGSYKGNGNADGAFIYTGFKPAFVIFKKSAGTGSWAIQDNKRTPFNVQKKSLFANLTDAETDSTNDAVDFLSNGFKFRSDTANYNTSGDLYIYMAFAENPFVTSTGVPATAR